MDTEGTTVRDTNPPLFLLKKKTPKSCGYKALLLKGPDSRLLAAVLDKAAVCPVV